MDGLVERLNAATKAERLEALRAIMQEIAEGKREKPVGGMDTNNHIHTKYSFSPYSPTKAVYMAYMAGLQTAGIMDHDSISGAEEFIEAGSIAGIATTAGVEMRVSFENTPFADRRINNPDQLGNLYTTLHGVPHTQFGKLREFLEPVCKARGERNRKMVDNINRLVRGFFIHLDYDKDVLPISMAAEGGGVTERHVLYAFALKLIDDLGKGRMLTDFLQGSLSIDLSEKAKKMLRDEQNPYYDYDLLGLLKAELVSRIYVKATDECVDVRDMLAFANEIGAIACAPYLGDIGDSVTGDKKAQTFEDAFLDELFDYYKQLGFAGCAYMPSRNTMAQLERVQALCDKLELIPISGEDINQPRQKFICEAARAEEFKILYDTTWALIGHELMATNDIEDAITGKRAREKYPVLAERIAAYKQYGLENWKNPDRR